MKKHALLLLMMAGIAVQAQNYRPLLNHSFEEWETLGNYDNPKEWYSLNQLTQFSFPATTELTSDAHSGTRAVKLVTKKASPTFDLPGVISTGPILDSAGNPDFSKVMRAFASRPSTLRFWYKSTPAPGDTCVLSFTLTRWNFANGRRDTIGIAEFAQGDTIPVYTQAVVNFSYSLPMMPDSGLFIASSSAFPFTPVVGGVFYLDDIELGYTTTGAEAIRESQPLGIYPNPASGMITLSNPLPGADLSIMDLNGRLITTVRPQEDQADIDISGLAAGVYVLKQAAHGETRYNKLIVK